MGCIALARCVLVLHCGLAVVVWYPYAGWSSASACIRIPHVLNMFRMLIHPSSGACDYLLSYFMGCIALIRCVLVLRCGLAVVVWYAYAGFSLHTDTDKMGTMVLETCWANGWLINYNSCIKLVSQIISQYAMFYMHWCEQYGEQGSVFETQEESKRFETCSRQNKLKIKH